MNIAIDASSLMTSHTGVHVYIREIIRAMRAQAGGPAIHAWQPGLYPWKAAHAPAKIFNNFRLFVWIQMQLGARMKRERCGILISPDFLSPRNLRYPKIAVVHDAGFVKRPGDFHPLWLRLWRYHYYPALRQAAAVVTVTEAAKKEICGAFGLTPDLVTVIPNAYDRTRFRPAPENECAAVVRRYGLEPNRYFIHVGVMEKRKNLPRLIRAYARIAPAHPEMKLLLIGPKGPKADMDDSAAVAEEIRRQNLAGRVILPGYAAAEDLPRLYQGARALVFPSLHEGFGIPVLEAFACGTAALCSATEVLREVARDGAQYFDPLSETDMARVLNAFLSDPEQRKMLIARGRERIAEYSWEESARKFIALAERLAGAAG